jgi:hypothetical protein
MQALANYFLILFLADGCVSLLDEIVALVSPLAALSELRIIIANVVVLLGAVLYALLGIDKRLPKRVFIPLVAFVILSPLLAWLVPSLSSLRAFGPLMAAAQISLILLVTWRYRRGRSVTLPRETFTGPAFSFKNLLGFSAANMVVLPCVLVLLVLSTADQYMQKYTAGFMHLGPDGLHMAEKVYRRGDKTIRLAAMIHIGEKQYYEKVGGGRIAGRTVILAEGVTDNQHLLRNRPDYTRFAGLLGLSSQQEGLQFKGKPIKAAELQAPKHPAVRPDHKPGEPDLLRADVDVSVFRPSTISFLDSLGKQMRESTTVGKQLLSSIAWSQKNVTPEMQESILDDILHRRNKVLLGYLKTSLPNYDTVVVPWGALHMAEIEAEVQKQGFQLQEVNDTVSIHFRK